MPIPLPNLDDRSFADLIEEARSLIPVLAPDWTDHNPGDPGIVLVELLAWLTEMLLFQVNQIPERNTRGFLRLLAGPQSPSPGIDDLDSAIRATMSELHERYRAVTAEDYEYLVQQVWPASAEAAGLGRIARVRCVPGRHLTATDPTAPAAAHVSVIVVPAADAPGPAAQPPSQAAPQPPPQPSAELISALSRFLHPRRMLATRHHVVGPSYADIGISANLALRDDSPPQQALTEARDRLSAFLDPLRGGAGGEGWPFGQSLHASEVYAVLEQVSLVDYAEDVRLTGPNPILDPNDQTSGIALAEHELIRLSRLDLVAYDNYGRTHPLSWEGAS